MSVPRSRLVALLLAALLLGGAAGAHAQDVRSIIVTLGIGVAVKTFAPQINTFINNLLQARDAETKATTKVVAAIDANFSGGWQIKALIPVDSLEPWKRLRRVVGVGVSAIIDVRI